MTTARPQSAARPPAWHALNKAIRAAEQAAGMGEPEHRALVSRVTRGRTESLGNCRIAEMNAILDHLNGGRGRQSARAELPQGYQVKAKALWITLYHLGVTRDGSDRALDAFVARQTRIEALRWLTPEKASKVIEALKDWAARAGSVDWSPYTVTLVDGVTGQVPIPRARVLEAQWRRLHGLGAVEIGSPAALGWWLTDHLNSPGRIGPAHLDEAEADRCIATLGAWIRRVQGAADGEAER